MPYDCDAAVADGKKEWQNMIKRLADEALKRYETGQKTPEELLWPGPEVSVGLPEGHPKFIVLSLV